MSYQVLARKWRPATFEQMVGQSHVLHALTNALSQQRLHHAYLFSGTRGVGKTSLARLFAKGLNCEQGVTASPCGVCSSCVEISEGRFVDLIEVDAASRTKVDDTRELLDNVQYRPSRGRYKVYLIDEVHMLSRSSFNALLKTLEEPPEHVKFLLATTDPQRLPVTVLSRCLQFNLKSLTQDEIANQLSHVLSQELIEFDKQSLSLLAKSASGSMRDALSLADQAIAFGAGKVNLAQVQTMLGSIDEQHVITLLNALIQGDIQDLMQVIDKVLSFGADPHEVLRSLLELLHQITLSQFAPAAAQLSIYSEQITAFSTQLSPEQVQLYYQLLLAGRKDLPHAPDPKSGLEMALLRAVAFVPETPVTRWVVDKPAKVSLPPVEPNISTGESHAELSDSSEVTVENSSENSAKSTAPQEKSQELSQQHVELATASEKSDESDNSEDDESDSLNALHSEQTLILSQAASQGMEQSDLIAPLSSNQPLDEPATLIDAKEVETPITEASEIDAAEVEPAQDTQPTEPQPSHISPDNPSDEQYLAQAQDNHFDYQTGSQVDEQNQNNEMDPGDYLPFDSLPVSQGVPVTSGAEVDVQQVEQVQTSQSVNTAQAAPHAEDDILDAVLAARESLLTDLANKPEESGGKKPEAQRKEFEPPKRKPSAEVLDKGDVQKSAENDGEPSRTEKLAAPVNNEIEDRPPWEEQESPQVAQSIAQHETKPAETGLSLAQDTDSVLTQPLTDTARTVLSHVDKTQNDSAPIDLAQMEGSDYDLLPPLGEGEITGNEIDLKWYRLMTAIDVGGRVRQLAVNSVCHEFTQPLSLLLKPNQKHLAAEIAIVQLEEALSRALETDECKVNITVGLDAHRETPLEIRQRFHREIQSQAHQSLLTDTNIQWLANQMGAELEPDSLSYSPELLSLKGNTIELIDKSNFKSLPQS